MSRTITGIFWVTLYLVVVLAPLFLMAVPPTPEGRDFWIELSIALGFVGLTQIAIQFALIARFRRATAPYGIDMILQYHRLIAQVAIALILVHPVILVIDDPALLSLLNPFGGSTASRMGVWAVITLLALAVLALYREQIALDYEVWRVTHGLMGIAAIVLAQSHVSLTGSYVNTAWKHALLIGFSAAMVSLLAYLRIIKPVLQRRRSFHLSEVRPERGDTWSLVVEADGHDGMSFRPGQFAWVKMGANPYSLEEHPFSFSSSAEVPDRLEFGIKELGDFTSRVAEFEPGTRVFLDGPHGAFSIDRLPAPGYVFVAGGIGITPIMSILRTMADRRDPRPAILFYGEKTWDEVAFREDLDELAERIDLEIVYVIEEPPDDWQGEDGFITGEVLARHLPDEKFTRMYMICGPEIMMDEIEEALIERGIPLHDIHTERFNLA